MKNESLIASGLYGTWTFATQTMTDMGYYKGRAYVIMHLMPDPMQVRSCQLKDCLEQSNHLCQKTRTTSSSTESPDLQVFQEKEVCVDTENSIVEWSDVTAFFQFGFQLRTGIAFKTYTFMNTSDWLGPYNLVMAPLSRRENWKEIHAAPAKVNTATNNNKTGDISDSPSVQRRVQKFASRYVTTPASSQLQFPPEATVLQRETFDRMVGMTAINQTIQIQQSLRSREDPYSAYRETCVHGDIPAGILPRIQLGMFTTSTDDIPRMTTPPHHNKFTSSSMIKTEFAMIRVDFSILSLPDPKSKLYKLWPTLQKHLGSEFPLMGPYCYGNDPNRAYAIQLAYDSTFDGSNNQTWKAIKGCLPDLPCWSDEGPSIPYDNNSTGQHWIDPTSTAALVWYILGVLLMISLAFNVKLSNQLKRIQQEEESYRRGDARYHNTSTATPTGRPVPQQQVFDAFHDMEEPLLLSGGDMMCSNEYGSGSGGVEESKVEATEQQ